MKGDCVHSAIERKLKSRSIHLPSDFISVTKEPRKNPSEYEALMVDNNFFKKKSIPELWRYASIIRSEIPKSPILTKAIHYEAEGIIKYKLNFDSDWENLPQ